MKKMGQWCVLAFVLWAALPFPLSQKNATSEKAVADLEQQWLKSQQTNDVDLLEPLLADGFTNTSNEGKVANKAQAIAEVKATKFASVYYTDLKVMVFGDTAIATGGFKAKGTDASGKSFDDNERFPNPGFRLPKIRAAV